MKKVAVLFAFILLLGTGLNAISGDKSPLLIVKLVIDDHTTQEDLISMQNFMSANGYALKVNNVRFDEAGHVKEINADVNFGKDRSGSFNTIDKLNGKTVRIEVTKTLLGGFSIEIIPD